MSSEWQFVAIEDIAAPHSNALSTGPFGSAISSKFFTDCGVPVIRGSNLSVNVSLRLIDDGIVFVAADKAAEFRRSVAKRGDLVFTCWGTINQVGLVDHRAGYDEYIVSNKQMKLTVDPAKADSLFLYYVFSGPEKQKEILDNGIGSSVPGFNLGQLKRHQALLPPLNEQKRISTFLGMLDDRITLLHETNTTLESIVQALFKSWFVDFDPVHAKQQGIAPEGLDEATVALFPDSFEESELGLVPKGWRVAKVGDVVESVGGGTPDTKEPSYWEPGVHCWTTPKDLSGIQAPVLLTTERKFSATGLAKVSSGLLPIGTLLLSSRAPIGYLAIAQIPLAINQGYIAMLPSSQLPPIYMLFWCRQNMEIIKGRANGSTFMEISKKAFRPIPALVPPAPALEAFVGMAGALFDRLVENEKQAETLTELRDTLLPRLISGQLRLPEAEAAMEEIVA
ncbi:EcoKI restriction-modification system protein HsdS [mine drainage metagenome]|uniref:EcoKI restriction-modification system protein HsdS n=1 Tax=mine drainage metagenome TaxID=410659 RepID=A0A1J5R4W6_9ZZZZ